MMRGPRRPSVRARLLLALVALAAATLIVGATSWITLGRATARLDHLHDETLSAVDRALVLSRQASDLATRAPYLLMIESPFRIRQEGAAARNLIAGIKDSLVPPESDRMGPVLQAMDAAVGDLVADSTARAGLTDQIRRQNAQIAFAERRFAALAGRVQGVAARPGGQDWLALQRIASALIGAGRADSLVSVGEFQRDYHRLVPALAALPEPITRAELTGLRRLAEGPEGLFELRRLEIAQKVAAEAALERIRRGADAVSLHAGEVTARAQSAIAEERARTHSAIAFAKAVITIVSLISAGVALATALFVSGHVTANLRAISEAMMRLAVGDRSSKLPRGEHAGDEIGTLFHAFRAFRANTLRLDRSNRQLAQRNALFENLFDGMSDGLAILSDTGALIGANRQLAEVLALDPALLTCRPAMAHLLTTAGWSRTPGTGGLADELRHREGRVIEARESRLVTGGSVMLLSDISARRALEERLQRVQRTETLGKIAGEVAHDFGNILSTITTSLHLLETAPPERAPGLRQSLGSALELGGSLTQRLLAFARRLNLVPEVIDLNALVEGVEDLIALAIDARVTLHLHPAPAPLMVRIDAGQMESALLNLCLNAAKAIPGEGRIDIRLWLLPGGQAGIEIEDTGTGMTPEVLAQAMEPFFTTRSDGTGTGLGLAMVYGFIQQSGGDIRIDSAPGAGTRVRLMLPLAEMPAADQTRAGGQTDAAGQSLAGPAAAPLRVLLVEDDPDDAAHAQRLLPGAVITLVTAADAALDWIATSAPFDLVLSDLHLDLAPAGWSIAEAALARGDNTRAVVISGHLPPLNPLADHPSGRAFVLAKPLDPAALAACLKGPIS